ncbi:MAG: GntR family transcriptional regulator [Puniceicoccaceae bacterium]
MIYDLSLGNQVRNLEIVNGIEIPKALTKQESAYRLLRRQIMEARLRPGEKVVIGKVAEQLEMSAIPVREAIKQLEREGLIRVKPHASAEVSDIPLQAIEEIFGWLESLEVAACRLGVKRLTGEVLDRLEALLGEMEASTDAMKWMGLNRRFHEAIPKFTGLTRLESELIRAGEEWERLRRLHYSGVPIEDRKKADAEHRNFLRVLKRGEEAAIRGWVEDHNRSALSRYLEQTELD